MAELSAEVLCKYNKSLMGVYHYICQESANKIRLSISTYIGGAWKLLSKVYLAFPENDLQPYTPSDEHKTSITNSSEPQNCCENDTGDL
jgi:hypothetical protein